MNKIQLLLKIVILYLCLNINGVVSFDQNLSDSDYNCTFNLLDKYKANQLSTQYAQFFDSVILKYDFCKIIECKVVTVGSSIYQVDKLFLEKIPYTPTDPSGPFQVSITNSDFDCFLGLSNLILKGFTISGDNFFTGDNLGISKSIYLDSCLNITIPSSFPLPTTSVAINIIEDIKNTGNTISASSFKGLEYFLMMTSLNSKSQLDLLNFPRIINNIKTISQIKLKSLLFFSREIPDLTDFEINDLVLKIYESDVPLGNGIDTYTNIKSINIDIVGNTIEFPKLLQKPNIVEIFAITSSFSEPTSLMDIRNSSNLKYFFYSPAPGSLPFAYPPNSILPFSELPISLQSFVFKGSSIKEPSILNKLPNLSYVDLSNNHISGPLVYNYNNSKIQNLLLPNNKLTGSIPEYDYCNMLLNVNGNDLLTGNIPMCFDCYKPFQSVISTNFGNTGLQSLGVCNLSPVPNFKITKMDNREYTIWGDNLGYQLPEINIPTDFEMVLVNRRFDGSLSIDLPIPKIVILNFMGQNYTLDVNPTKPFIKTIVYSSSLSSSFNIEGTSLTYNKSDISIVVDGYKCEIDISKYDFVTCHTVDTAGLDHILVNKGVNFVMTITIISTGFSTQVTIDPRKPGLNIVVYCNYECKNNKICNTLKGVCDCGTNWQSDDCSIPYITCLNNCSSLGTCNYTTGLCSCNPGYTGADCSKTNIFISSIEPTSSAGGLVKINGEFGPDGSGFSVTIGLLNCAVLNSTFSYIFCEIPGGDSGTKSLSIIHNTNSYFFKDMYHYEETSYKCSNDCSNHGTCNTKFGECKCFSGWGGFDCNSIKTTTPTTTTTTTTAGSTNTPTPTTTPEPVIIPPTETNINTTSGSAIINNQKTTYEILITSLVEIGFNNEIIKETALQNKWVANTSITNKYLFSQTLNDTSCLIAYSIEELKESRDYTFADLDLTLDKDSIKITVEIRDYPYTSTLNTLQLQFQSKIGTIETKDDGGECNHAETSIDTKQVDKNQLLNYITISKDSKTLYGRFVNRVISDTKPTFITVY